MNLDWQQPFDDSHLRKDCFFRKNVTGHATIALVNPEIKFYIFLYSRKLSAITIDTFRVRIFHIFRVLAKQV